MPDQNRRGNKPSRSNRNTGGGANPQIEKEPGRDDPKTGRTARDSTSINAADRDPIDPRMPHMPPP
jgi:hypothetical protein